LRSVISDLFENKLIRAQVQSPYLNVQIPFATPRSYFAARLGGRSGGYVNMISEST